jgi:hypothetical protein
MAKSKSLKVTLFNADPNAISYKGKKGMTLHVVHGMIGDAPSEVWEFKMRHFDTTDHVNGAFDSMKMEALLSDGWQQVTPSSVGHWEVVEKDGIKFGSTANSIKLF